MSGPTAAVARPRPAAIVSPIIDLLCVGGLSIAVLVPLLLSGSVDLPFVSIGALIWAQLLINMSHFMASYRIIYRDREMIRRHQWAAIWIPLILLGFAVLALLEARSSSRPALLLGFFVVSSGYLAWHYTGQVWGMMASFSYLSGIRFDPTERLLIRGSLRILLAWHVSWFLNFWIARTGLSIGDYLQTLYQAMTALTLVAFGLGAVGLLKLWRRTGRAPPLRAIVAWLAIFLWYAAVLRWGLKGLFLVQLFHAIQYLEFPARVELNRATRAQAGRAAAHMVLYAGGLLLVALFIGVLVPGPPMSTIANYLGIDAGKVAPVLLLYFINIHHYFTDGVIWKLSNPEVRKELFAHVAPAAAAPSAGAAASPKSKSGKARKRIKR
jgi:hypothetical protein